MKANTLSGMRSSPSETGIPKPHERSVTDEVTTLQDRTEGMLKEVSALEDRLTPILRADIVANSSIVATDSSRSCELQGSLADVSGTLMRIEQRLAALNYRIKL